MKIKDIYSVLREKGLYPELSENNNVIAAFIEWGDWKHDHSYLDYVMSELGYEMVNVKITEEDGSDCYSAIRYYKEK